MIQEQPDVVSGRHLRTSEKMMESSEMTPDTSNLVSLTSDIVSAYVSNNSVPVNEVPSLISSIHTSLAGLGTRQSQSHAAPTERLEPKVSIRKSVNDDYIICLEDGKKFKSLRRHLKSAFNMTPEQYRSKWGLPNDYPMVAPNYAAARSKLAKSMGLGSSRRKAK